MAKIQVKLPSNDYESYLQSPAWFRFREKVLSFWDHRCCICCSPHSIGVHHRTYVRLGHERLNDCVALCKRCHKMVTRKRRWYKQHETVHWMDDASATAETKNGKD